MGRKHASVAKSLGRCILEPGYDPTLKIDLHSALLELFANDASKGNAGGDMCMSCVEERSMHGTGYAYLPSSFEASDSSFRAPPCDCLLDHEHGRILYRADCPACVYDGENLRS